MQFSTIVLLATAVYNVAAAPLVGFMPVPMTEAEVSCYYKCTGKSNAEICFYDCMG